MHVLNYKLVSQCNDDACKVHLLSYRLCNVAFPDQCYDGIQAGGDKMKQRTWALRFSCSCWGVEKKKCQVITSHRL